MHGNISARGTRAVQLLTGDYPPDLAGAVHAPEPEKSHHGGPPGQANQVA